MEEEETLSAWGTRRNKENGLSPLTESFSETVTPGRLGVTGQFPRSDQERSPGCLRWSLCLPSIDRIDRARGSLDQAGQCDMRQEPASSAWTPQKGFAPSAYK
jgi:hypothetical protein